MRDRYLMRKLFLITYTLTLVLVISTYGQLVQNNTRNTDNTYLLYIRR